MIKSPLVDNINNIIKKIDQLGVRERGLILITSLVIVYSLWQSLVFDYITNLKQQLSGNASKIQQQISNLQGQISEVSNSLSLDPIIRLQEKIKKTKQENDDLQKKLVTMTEKLIPPKEMTALLKNILENKDLKVVHVENIAPVPLFSGSKDGEEEDQKKAAKEAALRFQVYKHGIEIVFTGTFFQVRDFLADAENLPWKVLWEELEFSVDKYPTAKVRVVIKTLSINANLLGTS
jgi:MSHA biogenesis protein MshJ